MGERIQRIRMRIMKNWILPAYLKFQSEQVSEDLKMMLMHLKSDAEQKMAKNVFFLSNMRIKHTRVAQLILMKRARPGAQPKWTKMETMLKLAKIMDSV